MIQEFTPEELLGPLNPRRSPAALSKRLFVAGLTGAMFEDPSARGGRGLAQSLAGGYEPCKPPLKETG